MDVILVLGLTPEQVDELRDHLPARYHVSHMRWSPKTAADIVEAMDSLLGGRYRIAWVIISEELTEDERTLYWEERDRVRNVMADLALVTYTASGTPMFRHLRRPERPAAYWGCASRNLCPRLQSRSHQESPAPHDPFDGQGTKLVR